MSVPKATEFAAIVAVRVALPKLVNVAEPVTSPARVSVGSEVAVVVMLILLPPLKLALPVTAPVRAILRAVCKVVAVVALPDKADVTVPAEKLPEASLATSVEAVLAVALCRSSAAAVIKTSALPERFSKDPVLLSSSVRESVVPDAV